MFESPDKLNQVLFLHHIAAKDYCLKITLQTFATPLNMVYNILAYNVCVLNRPRHGGGHLWTAYVTLCSYKCYSFYSIVLFIVLIVSRIKKSDHTHVEVSQNGYSVNLITFLCVCVCTTCKLWTWQYRIF